MVNHQREFFAFMVVLLFRQTIIIQGPSSPSTTRPTPHVFYHLLTFSARTICLIAVKALVAFTTHIALLTTDFLHTERIVVARPVEIDEIAFPSILKNRPVAKKRVSLTAGNFRWQNLPEGSAFLEMTPSAALTVVALSNNGPAKRNIERGN
jgi:hypothetical protein